MVSSNWLLDVVPKRPATPELPTAAQVELFKTDSLVKTGDI